MWDSVGLDDLDGSTYEALVGLRQAGVEDLAAATGTSAGRVRTTIAGLVRRGLATRLPGQPARYAPVPPDLVAAELISAQERRHRQFRSHLQQLATAYAANPASRHPAELIEVLEGAQNVRSAFRRLQDDAVSQVRVFDRPPYFNSAGSGAFEVNEDELQALERSRVTYRVIYERDVLAEPGRMADVWAGVRQGERARLAGTLPLKLAIADDRIALVNSTSDFDAQTAYLVHPSALLDALIGFFEATWSRSVALNQPTPGTDRAPVADALTDERRDLVGMLAGGLTDEAMARALEVSVRTVQRHIHTLMDAVGAETRLQLGMELVRHGWA